MHMIAEFVESHLVEAMATYLGALAGLRSLFFLSWSRECTGTFGDRIVLLAATMK
jgi:hypothetical protein